MPETPQNQLVDDVFPAELEVIARRRECVGVEGKPLKGPPRAELGLTGLALSGGGIRSATFSHGVIQALAQRGLLRSVDYLSTVSGGGYTGSCLSSLLNAPGRTEPERFPLRYRSGERETPAMTHLRNGSNYLSPGGFIEALRLPILLVRGVLLNIVLVLPLLMAFVFLTEVLYEKGKWLRVAPTYVLAALFATFGVLVLTFPFVSRVLRRRFGLRQRNVYDWVMAVPALLACLCVCLIPVGILVDQSIELSWYGVPGVEGAEGVATLLAERFDPRVADNLWGYLVGVAVVLAFVLAGKASKNVSKWTGKLLLAMLGVLGPAILFAIYLLLCVLQIDSPFIPRSLEVDLIKGAASDDASPSAGLLAAFGRKGISIQGARIFQPEGEADTWILQPDASTEYVITKEPMGLHVSGAGLDLWDGERDVYFLAAFSLLLLFNYLFFDVNITSFHNFYRDRLSKLYLFDMDEEGELHEADHLRLSELNADGSAAPYHLINVALNLTGCDDPCLRGRNADFFVFSKCFTGSERTGYCPTEEMERADDHLNLASTMAISAAAASPNMGATTVRTLVFIMTLLNVRLGYWIPNPGRVLGATWLDRFRFGRMGLTYMLKEALGAVDADGCRVNVSDGGHIENLAIWPLLQRRCKFIVAVDGEADPSMTFHGLATVMRFARIDLGIQIEIDLDELRRDVAGLSREHFGLGRIDYGNGEYGHLLYMKLSVTGDENEYVLSYRSDEPAFPHQPTSDQFFDETQFEAYRELGYHVGCNAIAAIEERDEYRPLLGRGSELAAVHEEDPRLVTRTRT